MFKVLIEGLDHAATLVQNASMASSICVMPRPSYG
jgi:hypothetical protein